MSGVAIGLNSITKASQNLNSRNITTLATSMGKIAGVDSAQISRVAGSMTQLKNSISGGFNTDMTGIVNVANSLSKLGGKNATQGAQNLVLIKDQLAQFVQGMNSVGTFTFDPTGLTNTIKAIAKLGGKTATQATANLPSISAQLQNFVRQMNQIGSMSFDNKNLTDLVTSIGRLGSVASGRAVNNIPLLANNLKYLFDTLSKAPNVSQNIIQMTTALANLARTGASSGTAARSLGTSLFFFSKSAGNARKSAFSLAGAIGKFYATYWMVIRGLGLFRNAIDISSDLTEVENVVRTTFGNMEYKVNDFVQNSIQQFGMSELSVKQYASTFQAMGTAMDVGSKQIENANRFLNGATDGYIGLSDSMSDVSLNLTKLTADTHEITTGGYYDGTGVTIASTGNQDDSQYALNITTTEKVVVAGVTLTGVRGVQLKYVNRGDFNFTLLNSTVTVSARGIQTWFNEGQDNKGAKVNVNNCVFSFSGISDYDTFVNNNSSVGLILNGVDEAEVNIKGTTIQGFAYSVQFNYNTNKPMPNCNSTLNVEDSVLKGRAGVYLMKTSTSTVNIKNSTVRGVNTFKNALGADNESFGLFVFQYSHDTVLNIQDCKLEGYRGPAAQFNQEYVADFKIDNETTNNTVNILGNTTMREDIHFTVDSEFFPQSIDDIDGMFKFRVPENGNKVNGTFTKSVFAVHQGSNTTEYDWLKK